MEIEFIKSCSSTICGNRVAGDKRDVPDGYARMLIEAGIAVQLEVQKSGPFGASGMAKPSASSLVAQASTSQTLNTSEESAESSPSTAASGPQNGVTQSTLVTDNGGTDTTQKSRRGRRSGRRTTNQP